MCTLVVRLVYIQLAFTGFRAYTAIGSTEELQIALHDVICSLVLRLGAQKAVEHDTAMALLVCA